MRVRVLGVAVAGVLLVSAAPEKIAVKMAPADDKVALIGAAARAKNGPEPLTKPSEDIGMAEDPPAANAMGQQTAPLPHPVPAPRSR